MVEFCVICGKRLTGNQRKFCSDNCKAKDWYKQHPKKVKLYRKKIKEKFKKYHKKWQAEYRKKNRITYNLYCNIHWWVRKRLPKPEVCTICNEIKELELSNISGEYKRDINDFWYLCQECHILFDKINQTYKKEVKVNEIALYWKNLFNKEI